MSVRIVRGGVVRIVVRALARSAASHHSRSRMTLHSHVAHCGWIGAGVAGGSGPIWLVNHWLDNSPTRVDEPVVDLEYAQSRVLRQLFLLILAGVGMGQVLEQPGAQNIGCNLRKDSALFTVFIFAGRIVIVAPRAVGGPNAGVAVIARFR